MINLAPFEIIVENGTRFRCSEGDLFWEYEVTEDPYNGVMEIENKSQVNVYREIDNSPSLVAHFNDVVMVGSVDNMSYLELLPAKRTTQCPNCGYKEHELGSY